MRVPQMHEGSNVSDERSNETNVTYSSGGQPPPMLPADGEVADRERDTSETNDVPSTSMTLPFH